MDQSPLEHEGSKKCISPIPGLDNKKDSDLIRRKTTQNFGGRSLVKDRV